LASLRSASRGCTRRPGKPVEGKTMGEESVLQNR
jgi:hypothetical protein